MEIGGLAVLAALPALADERLEEGFVTAQRREENLQDVPVSAAAYSSLQLERLQVDDLALLQNVTASLSVAPGQATGASASIGMRGQFESDTTPAVDPPVGLYLDGVYFARMTGANLDLVDLERVEVLRGPQGTLFGRNTIGGAINLVPRHPTGEVAASAKVEFGSYDYRKVTGIVNAPTAGGRIAMRLTAMHREHGGYARDPLLNRELANEDTNFARLQFQVAPVGHLRANLAIDYSRIRSASQTLTLFALAPGAASVPAMLGTPGDSLTNYLDPYGSSVSANRVGIGDTAVWGAAATLTMELAPLTLKSITAYRALDSSVTDSDQDGTPYDLGVILYRNDRQHQFSQELQLLGSALRQRLTWIGGLLYFEENAAFEQLYQIFSPVSRSFIGNIPSGDAINRSVAAYAQLSFALTPRIKLTAGARYNEDARQLTSHNARVVDGIESCRLSAALLDQPGVCTATRPTRYFDYAPLTASLEFRPVRPALLYAKVSRGFRAGGYNIRGTTEMDLDTFEPEYVDSFEIGAKSELFDDRLRANLALFHTKFKDIQLVQHEQVPGQIGSLRFIRNGGEARIDGGELEIVALLRALRLTAALGVTDARFTKLNPGVADVTLESTFLLAPEHTASIAADLPIAVDFGALDVHADYSWRDDVSFAYDPASPARQGAYGLLNAMLAARFDRARLEVSLWGRNLTGQSYATRAWENDFYVSAALGSPRTYGISVAYQFGAEKAGG